MALSVAPASAATLTVGQIGPTNPPTGCTGGSIDFLEPVVNGGTSYVVPTAGTIISWSTSAAAPTGQLYTFKVFRKVGDPNTYRVIAHDGPRPLTPSVVNTFATSIPVQSGDVIGFHGAAVNHACVFASPTMETYLTSNSDLADDQQAAFAPFGPNTFRLNISATLALKPSNSFSFGKLKRNKRKGTAVLAVEVPGPGTLSLRGEGLKPQRAAGGAAFSKVVTGAGVVNLKVKAKGNARFKLNHTGKARVKATITFSPRSEIAGDPKALVKRVKLIKR